MIVPPPVSATVPVIVRIVFIVGDHRDLTGIGYVAADQKSEIVGYGQAVSRIDREVADGDADVKCDGRSGRVIVIDANGGAIVGNYASAPVSRQAPVAGSSTDPDGVVRAAGGCAVVDEFRADALRLTHGDGASAEPGTGAAPAGEGETGIGRGGENDDLIDRVILGAGAGGAIELAEIVGDFAGAGKGNAERFLRGGGSRSG